MHDIKFGSLIKVCEKMGLTQRNGNGSRVIYSGVHNNNYVNISIHVHKKSKSIPKGTLRKAIKDLGFESVDDLLKFMAENKIK